MSEVDKTPPQPSSNRERIESLIDDLIGAVQALERAPKGFRVQARDDMAEFRAALLAAVSGTPAPETKPNELEACHDRMAQALKEICDLTVTGPSPLGALHGAGMAKGFEIAADIANKALEASCSPDQHDSAYVKRTDEDGEHWVHKDDIGPSSVKAREKVATPGVTSGEVRPSVDTSHLRPPEILTDEQCSNVIESLESRDWKGFSCEDIRMLDSLIETARSAQKAGKT